MYWWYTMTLLNLLVVVLVSFLGSVFIANRRVQRDMKNKLFGGVCAGIANRFGVSIDTVRFIFVLFSPTIIPMVLYAACYFTQPEDSATTAAA